MSSWRDVAQGGIGAEGEETARSRLLIIDFLSRKVPNIRMLLDPFIGTVSLMKRDTASSVLSWANISGCSSGKGLGAEDMVG